MMVELYIDHQASGDDDRDPLRSLQCAASRACLQPPTDPMLIVHTQTPKAIYVYTHPHICTPHPLSCNASLL